MRIFLELKMVQRVEGVLEMALELAEKEISSAVNLFQK